MSLLNIAVKGDLEQYMRDEIALKRRADLYALQVGSQVFQQRLSGETASTLGSRLGRSWKARVYANPVNPAALVYSKAPAIISSFLADTIIIPRHGKHLAVPTGFNRVGGQRGGKVRVTPKQMIDLHQSFTRPRKNGPGLIWFLTVSAKRGEGTRVDAIAGKLVQVGRHGPTARAIIKAGAVPMFVLLPQVKHARRIDAESVAKGIADELPKYLAEGYAANDRGAA